MKSTFPVIIAVTLSLFIGSFVFKDNSNHSSAKETAYERVLRMNTLRVGYTLWPPYQMQDPNTGEISGLTVDYMDVVAKLLDVKLEWVPMAGMGTQVEGLKQGLYDVVANDGPYVFSMIKFIDFSDPLYYAPVFAYVRADDTRFHSLEQLDSPNITFVGLDGDLSTDLAQRIYTKATIDTLPASTDPGMLMTNVHNKKGDVTIIDPASVTTFNKNNKPGLKVVSSRPIAVYPIGFSMMKEDGKLLTLINGIVAAIHNTNAMDPLLIKWFPEKDDVYRVEKLYGETK